MKAARGIAVLVSVAGLVLLAGAGWVWWHYFRPLPSDAEVRARFEAHRSELDRLVAMAQADSQLVGAGHDPWLMRFTVFVRDTPSAHRLLSDGEVRSTGRQDFRRLLDRAGLPSIGRSAEGGTVWFVIRRSGGISKGIVYSEDPLAPTRPALDSLDRTPAARGTAFHSPLGPPRWYLFLEPRFD